MTVTAPQLLGPLGDVEPAMFPGDDESQLVLRMSQYLSRATALTVTVPDADLHDAATRAYAYYLAFQATATRLSAEAMSLSFLDAGSRSRTQQQIDYFIAKAAEYLATFTALVPLPEDAVEGTQSVVTYLTNCYRW